MMASSITRLFLLCLAAPAAVQSFSLSSSLGFDLSGTSSKQVSVYPQCSFVCRKPIELKTRISTMQRMGRPLSLSMASGYTVEKTADLEGGAARYKFTVDVPADLTKTSYATIMKDFKKNAKFPGFRVGTVPSFMLPKVRSFVILECLERTLKDAVENEKLQLANPEKKPTLDDEQVTTLTKSFKETDGFSYTIEGEFKAAAEEAPPS